MSDWLITRSELADPSYPSCSTSNFLPENFDSDLAVLLCLAGRVLFVVICRTDVHARDLIFSNKRDGSQAPGFPSS
ncbi:hypothetical protein PILCRDRAFT_821675 [Piloderma croceum F 1598]|uniref:Uncharacterized protein n=1 Tax=Piloderma croceum (strain F 1598) TaxID=765440 RepID=A0A0C3BV70_PILCF|nr:hypothetical protein PILCRDRAFT_821675 [Piloderma croceum F 1598]